MSKRLEQFKRVKKLIRLENLLIAGSLLVGATGAGIAIQKALENKPTQCIVYALSGFALGLTGVYGYDKTHKKKLNYYNNLQNDN